MKSEGRLAGEVALVTGSTRGIGRAIAHRFAAEGARVVVTGRSEDVGAGVEREIRAAGGEAHYVRTDLADEQQVARAVEAAVERYDALTILVNNAAPTELMGPGRLDRSIVEVSDESWDRIMQVALKALVWTSRHAVPRIAQAGGGAVLHISSAAALRGVAGLDTYTAAKGAINALTRSMAVELAPQNVRVNTIVSGMVLTSEGAHKLMEHPEIGPATRAMHLTDLGEPEDIAAAALFLCSREARFITGVNLPVDGGATCMLPVPDISAASPEEVDVKTVSVGLRIKQGRAEEFARGVAKMVEALEQVDGTLAFLVSRSERDPHEFRFFEIYRDEPAFQEHLRVASSELPGRAAMDELVDGPFRPSFGELVAGGRWLDAPGA